MIGLAAVEDNRLLIDGLRAWARTQPDICLAEVHPTVDGLLRAVHVSCDVVLLNPLLRADPDPGVNATARSLGISPETARTYLKRVKAKYHQAGLPVYTKLELAQQVRSDCTAGTCERGGRRRDSRARLG